MSCAIFTERQIFFHVGTDKTPHLFVVFVLVETDLVTQDLHVGGRFLFVDR